MTMSAEKRLALVEPLFQGRAAVAPAAACADRARCPCIGNVFLTPVFILTGLGLAALWGAGTLSSNRGGEGGGLSRINLAWAHQAAARQIPQTAFAPSRPPALTAWVFPWQLNQPGRTRPLLPPAAAATSEDDDDDADFEERLKQRLPGNQVSSAPADMAPADMAPEDASKGFGARPIKKKQKKSVDADAGYGESRVEILESGRKRIRPAKVSTPLTAQKTEDQIKWEGAEGNYVRFLILGGAFILLEGLFMSTAPFIGGKADEFALNVIYPSFSPTVGVFLTFSTIYGALKATGGTKE